MDTKLRIECYFLQTLGFGQLDLRFQVESSMQRVCVHLLFGLLLLARARIARLTSPKHTSPHKSRAAAPTAKSFSARRSAGWSCPAGPLPQCNGTLLRRRCQAGGNHESSRPKRPSVECVECSIPQSPRKFGWQIRRRRWACAEKTTAFDVFGISSQPGTLRFRRSPRS